MKHAFTLIELLVVVLIIGILAAIALPQYQKAVWKSRNVQLKALLNAMMKAQTEYYLANGEYAKSLGDLSIDLPNWSSYSSASGFFTTTGEDDSVRYNGQILIGISSSFNNYVVWQDGPYKMGGFRGRDGKISCIERGGEKTPFSQGDFCVKIEQVTTDFEYTSSWRYWEMQ